MNDLDYKEAFVPIGIARDLAFFMGETRGVVLYDLTLNPSNVSESVLTFTATSEGLALLKLYIENNSTLRGKVRFL